MNSRLLALPLSLLLAASGASAIEYSIDTDHSSVGFKVKHLGISSVSGKFLEFSGTVSFDPDNISASSTQASIETASVDTQQKKRDDHLRGEDFLLAEKNPTIEFKSKEVSDVKGSTFKVRGDLTLRGVTKPVVLDVEYGGSVKDPMGNDRAAFTATTKIDRKDFGVNFSKTLDNGGLVVGNEVTVILEIEGIKKKEA